LDNLETFNIKLAELMNESKLPVSALRMALQNIIYQLDILKIKQELICKENNEIKLETEIE